jgi:hypothetical protein
MSSGLAYVNLHYLNHEQDQWAQPNSMDVMHDACMMFIKFTENTSGSRRYHLSQSGQVFVALGGVIMVDSEAFSNTFLLMLVGM